MRALALALAFAAPTCVFGEEIRTISWADLRPADDPQCVAEHQRSQSIEMCKGMPSDILYHSCGAQTVEFGSEPVRIAGYAHPVEIEFSDIRTFLLVPPLVPCHHRPAPMANQIILVDSEIGIDASFDPIFVTGVIEPALSLHGFTQIRYKMTATNIEPALIPDVRK